MDYSIEIVMLCVFNDINLVFKNFDKVVLVLFDLLFVFEIIDYGVFIKRLCICFGLSGFVFVWIEFYLVNCL